MLSTEDFEHAQVGELRTITYTWENLGICIQKFQVSARFGDFEAAEESRIAALATLEANLDAFMALYKRLELSRGG